MIKLKINNINEFENFLSIISKFVQQCQFEVYKDRCEVYCKNQAEFSTCRLDLKTNLLTLDKSEEIDIIKICIRDIIAFRSSINIISLVEPDNKTIELNIEEIITPEQEYFGRFIEYKGKTKFKLITVDRQVIDAFVSKKISADLSNNIWSFNIDPKKLDIIQNRTGNIVNIKDDVSVYFYGDKNTNNVICDLKAKQSTYNNSIALPIADSYIGELNSNMSEISIHDSSFRLMNILRVTDAEHLSCKFNSDYNVLQIQSDITKDEYYINSYLIIQIIKGK